MKQVILTVSLILFTALRITFANVTVDTLVDSNISWNGSAFAYAQGNPKIVVKKITATAQKDAKKFHCHPVPLVAYINKGKVTLQTKSGDNCTFLAGDSLEVMNQWHMANFAKSTEIIAFYLGNDKLPGNVFAGDKLASLYR